MSDVAKHHSKTLHLSDGYYVAFSGPTPAGTKDRITVPNDHDAFKNAGEAQAVGVQHIYYDLEIKDVAIECAGVDVPRATPLPVVELVRTQRARVFVTPSGSRRYALMTSLPKSGTIVQVDGDTVIAQDVNGTELVEVARKYEWLAPQNRFDSALLNHHKTHLPGDIDVPVRQFMVSVVDTVGFRRKPLHTEPVLLPADRLTPGEVVYLLVPTPVITKTSARAYVAALPPGPHAHPHAPLEELKGDERKHEAKFLGTDGVLYRVRIDDEQPCEQACDVTYTLDVGAPVAAGGVQPKLTAVLRLDPHFRLELVGVAANGPATVTVGRGDIRFVAVGAVLDANSQPVVHGLPGVTATIVGNELVVAAPAGTALGRGRVVVRDPANPTHQAQREIEVV